MATLSKPEDPKQEYFSDGLTEVLTSDLSKLSGLFVISRNLAAIYSRLGRQEEARAEAAEILRISPNYSLEWAKQALPFKDPAVLERHLEAQREAGLK